MNKIKSFKSFSDVLAHEATIKLAVENNAKREELSTKIASILDSMEITSLEGLDEEQKTALISQLFGEISEEEVEGESDDAEPVVNDEEPVEENMVADKDIEKEIKKLEDENPKGFEKEIKRLKVRQAALKLAEKNEIVEEITEAIKVEGKRDAKKVVTVYNKIFNKVLVDLGAMSTESILGCIKYLMHEAMVDANFHREALPVSKMIKGNIKPLEIKMTGLGGHFVKIGPATIKTILDKYYSDIANAAGWGGQGIVEGTALYLEQIKQEGMGQAAINQFNQSFEGESIRIDLDSKLNESNDVELITVSDETTKLEERNAFLGARAKAIEEDLEEFEFNGKMYPVTVNESTVLNEGTRGQFGKIDKSGNITSVYTHYDSYPENMLPIIKKSFKNGKNVDDVLSKGANSGLSTDISKINFYNDGTSNTTGSIKNIDNYLKDADRDGGAEFVYLWDEKSKKWMMADIYQGSGLVPAFESIVTESIKCSNKKGHAYKEIDNDGTVECEYCGLRNSLSESVVTEAKSFKNTKDFEEFLKEIDAMPESAVRKIMGKEYIDTPGFYEDEKDDYDDVIDFMISNMGADIYHQLEQWWENNVQESAVTEAKFVKDFNRDVLNAKTKEEVLELYPNAEFFIGKSDHFFGELDGNLFFKAYYTKAQKEFEIKSVYSEKGSNYVHLYNESIVTEAKELFQLDIDSDEHGALGLSVTMKELKDTYKKNKKDINDVEDLLLKFVYDQPEDFAANDTEGMEISGADSGDVYAMLAKEFGIKESVVNEAEIKSDEEFQEYAFTVLKKAFGDDFDEAKGQEIVDGILSKSDGDYGAAVGMLTSSLG